LTELKKVWSKGCEAAMLFSLAPRSAFRAEPIIGIRDSEILSSSSHRHLSLPRRKKDGPDNKVGAHESRATRKSFSCRLAPSNRATELGLPKSSTEIEYKWPGLGHPISRPDLPLIPRGHVHVRIAVGGDCASGKASALEESNALAKSSLVSVRRSVKVSRRGYI
jgi:hypothetical protein